MSDEVQDLIMSTIEASLDAQLRAVRRLRKLQKGEEPAKERSRSQMSIVRDVLQVADRPLHVTEIIERAKGMFGIELERESIVSALSKKVIRKDTFKRTDKNTFELLGGDS